MKLDFEPYFPAVAPPTELETQERLQMNVAIHLGLTGIAGAMGFLAPPAGLAFGCIVFGLGLFLKE